MKTIIKWVCGIFEVAFRGIKPEDLAGCESIPGVMSTMAYANQ